MPQTRLLHHQSTRSRSNIAGFYVSTMAGGFADILLFIITTIRLHRGQSLVIMLPDITLLVNRVRHPVVQTCPYSLKNETLLALPKKKYIITTF